MPPTAPDTFAARLTRLRAAKSWTGYRLAKAAGTTPAHVYRLERGEQEPSLTMAVRLARALGVGLEELVPE